MTQAAVTQTAAVTTEISNSKDDSNNMTTHNSRNAGRVYIMVSCAAPEGVYTQRPVFLLEMSTLQGPELHLDVSTLKRPVLLLDMSTLQMAVLHLHMDVSTPQRPELHLDLSTLQRPALLLEVFTLQRP